MAIELAGISLLRLTEISVEEQARIKRHAVPGMSGDLAQTLGRSSVAVSFRGIFYGENAAEDLNQLRGAYLGHRPVDFFAEAVGEGYFAQVLISRLEVSQRAGYPGQFDFACQVVEYVEPPEPITIDPLGVLDAELLDEASAFIDDVQNALEQVSQLTDLIANVPMFGDPTERLPQMLSDYQGAAGGAEALLSSVQDLF